MNALFLSANDRLQFQNLGEEVLNQVQMVLNTFEEFEQYGSLDAPTSAEKHTKSAVGCIFHITQDEQRGIHQLVTHGIGPIKTQKNVLDALHAAQKVAQQSGIAPRSPPPPPSANTSESLWASVDRSPQGSQLRRPVQGTRARAQSLSLSAAASTTSARHEAAAAKARSVFPNASELLVSFFQRLRPCLEKKSTVLKADEK